MGLDKGLLRELEKEGRMLAAQIQAQEKLSRPAGLAQANWQYSPSNTSTTYTANTLLNR